MKIKTVLWVFFLLFFTSCGKVSTTPSATGTSSETPSVPVTSTPTPAASQNTTAVAPQNSNQNQTNNNSNVSDSIKTDSSSVVLAPKSIPNPNLATMQQYNPCQDQPCTPQESKEETEEDIKKSSLPPQP